MSRRLSRGRDALGLLASLASVSLVAALGGLTTAPAVATWYRTLDFPPFQPPPWVFGPAWTTLYLLMAVAAWLVWRRGGEGAPRALAWHAGQLILNALWSPAFFGLRSPALGLAVMVLLWPAILLTILAFRRCHRVAAWLLAPYLAWVSFAFVLNASIWLLNR